MESLTLKQTYSKLLEIKQDLLAAEKAQTDQIASLPETSRESARNLVHYLELRRHDIRSVQMALSSYGLSSLGRLEAHVMSGIDAVLFALKQMTGDPDKDDDDADSSQNMKTGDELLLHNTSKLLGARYSDRLVRIMVTMPTEVAGDYRLLLALMMAGMNIARINSAHDDSDTWRKMVRNIRKAEKELNRECKILFDLGGPKLRTGNIDPGPAVVRLNPKKDERGTLIRPATAWLGVNQLNLQKLTGGVFLPVEESFHKAIELGDKIQLTDIQGRKRTLQVVEANIYGIRAECSQNAYLESGTPLKLVRKKNTILKGKIGELPNLAPFIWLQEGNTLMVTREQMPKATVNNRNSRSAEPASIPCTLPEVFNDVRVGDPILFDDGKIGGMVTEIQPDLLKVTITRTPPGGTKLRPDKGINLPQTDLSSPSISTQDLENLDFAAKYCDLIGLSFVRRPADIHLLQNELKKRKAKDIGVILKIENQMAFDNLAQLLLTSMEYPPFGVMVARGDLGVEIGFENLAEAQEQILWLCEAAHVPVIWATQVLESLAKKGMPTRAEVSDAAMSGRAECVMLNKGPYIVKTVTFLDKILEKMREHNYKKTPILRKLKVSEGRFSS